MRWKWWARSQGAGDTAADRLAAEPEAWLAGTYIEWLLSHHRLVPTWAWLNPAAHLERQELEQLAGMQPNAANGWGLSCYLAGELLTAADRDGVDVGVLQRERLVPLELDLCRRNGTLLAMRRNELAPMVSTALRTRARS